MDLQPVHPANRLPLRYQFRFRLRTLLIMASLVSAFFAVLGQYGCFAGAFCAFLFTSLLLIVGFSTDRSYLVQMGFAVGAIALIVALIGYVGFSETLMNAHAVPIARFNQLSKGMSKTEVLHALGEPTIVHRDADGSVTWTYGRNTWCYVTTHFSPAGRFTFFVHDH